MAKSKWPDVQEKLQSGLVEAWARDGLTDEQIAYNLGIAVSTFYVYKEQHEEFSEALKRGKEVVDYEVENALLKRALGYGYEEITYEEGKPVKKVTKQVAPDVTAQIYWLKNRKPDKWRDKPNGIDAVDMDDDGFLDALDSKLAEVWDDAPGDI